MKKIFLLPLIVIPMLAGVAGCYYDRESELYPQGICDTSTVKYSATIRPIMDAHCAYAGCHEGANAPSGINLTGYDGVRAIALDGSLVGSVGHQQGYVPMPRSSAKLPDCLISQIRIWVTGGAQNN